MQVVSSRIILAVVLVNRAILLQIIVLLETERLFTVAVMEMTIVVAVVELLECNARHPRTSTILLYSQV